MINVSLSQVGTLISRLFICRCCCPHFLELNKTNIAVRFGFFEPSLYLIFVVTLEFLAVAVHYMIILEYANENVVNGFIILLSLCL